MVKPRDIIAGALALEFGDVIIVAVGAVAVVYALYLAEQAAEKGLQGAIDQATLPFTSWYQYLFGTGDSSDTGQ